MTSSRWAANACVLASAMVTGCTLVSGTSELSGGSCLHCADAGATDATSRRDGEGPRRLACGSASCDTSTSWCCLGAGGTTSCADPCPTGSAAIACVVPTDCPTGQSCCAFRSSFAGESEVRPFADCLATCNPATDEPVCDRRQGVACGGGKSCVAGEIPGLSVCR